MQAWRNGSGPILFELRNKDASGRRASSRAATVWAHQSDVSIPDPPRAPIKSLRNNLP